MTAWHRRWQQYCVARPGWLIESMVEVGGAMHIADAVTSGGQVFEFQHSKIKLDEIRERNADHHPLMWVIDGTEAMDEGLIGAVGSRFAWMTPPNWLFDLVVSSGWVLLDLGDRVLRISEPQWHGPACAFTARAVSSRSAAYSGDEYRVRLLDVVGLLATDWDREEFLDWTLSDAAQKTVFLAARGATPAHAIVWLNGSGTNDLVDVHRTAEAVGWTLPSDVFRTSHGTWLEKMANLEGDYYTVGKWFDRSYGRKGAGEAGVPKGPAAEWCNQNRDADILIEAHTRLIAADLHLGLVWAEHRAHRDRAWRELKELDNDAAHRLLDRADHALLVEAWVTRRLPRSPYSSAVATRTI